MGNIETPMNRRSDGGGLRRGCPPPGQVTLRLAGLEHLRKGNFCLHGGLGNFSASVYGDGSGAQSCCFSCSSHPTQASKCSGQISVASHPGKSQSDRLARSPGAARQENQLLSIAV